MAFGLGYSGLGSPKPDNFQEKGRRPLVAGCEFAPQIQRIQTIKSLPVYRLS